MPEKVTWLVGAEISVPLLTQLPVTATWQLLPSVSVPPAGMVSARMVAPGPFSVGCIDMVVVRLLPRLTAVPLALRTASVVPAGRVPLAQLWQSSQLPSARVLLPLQVPAGPARMASVTTGKVLRSVLVVAPQPLVGVVDSDSTWYCVSAVLLGMG